MKFNLEKVKKIAKKTVIGAEIVATSVLPIKSFADTNNNDGLINIKNTPNREIKFQETNNTNTNINILELENQDSEFSEEDIKIIKNIIELEKQFKKLSKGETEIAEGSMALISGGALLNKIKSNNDITYVPSLDNRYITDLVSNEVFNSNNNLKLMSKDYLVMSESQSLHDEKWVNFKEGGYTKHLLPEYYFIINQKEIHGKIIFEIKILYSKIKRIDTIKIIERLPSGDIFELEKFVKEKIAKDLSNAINDKMEELKLLLNK